jgi:hypothetical protein
MCSKPFVFKQGRAKLLIQTFGDQSLERLAHGGDIPLPTHCIMAAAQGSNLTSKWHHGAKTELPLGGVCSCINELIGLSL